MSTAFLFIAKSYSSVDTLPIVFMYSSIDGNLGHLSFVYCVALIICVQFLYEYIFIIFQDGIIESNGKCG